MMGLRIGLAVVVLLSQIVLWVCNWGLKSRLEIQQQASSALAQQLATTQDTANQLNSTLEIERAAKMAVLKLHSQLLTDLNARERQIEDLKRENKALQDWADQPLPDAARRLRERPAITGADAYRKWLSGSGAVHPPGNIASQQRPTAD